MRKHYKGVLLTPDANTDTASSSVSGASTVEDANHISKDSTSTDVTELPSEIEELQKAAIETARKTDTATDEEPSVVDDAATSEVKAATVKPSTEQPTVVQPTSDKEPVVEDKDKVDEILPPFHTHPRWQEMVQKNQTLTQEAVALKPKAEAFDQIVGYMQQNSISQEELNQALSIVALSKRNPKAAVVEVKNYLTGLEIQLGDRFAPDIQQKLDANIIDIETAKALMQARVEKSLYQKQVEDMRRGSVQQQQNLIMSSVNSWVQAKQQSDPDFKQNSPKWNLIRNAVTYLESQTPPSSPTEAVALMEKAYKEVNDILKASTPTPPKRRSLSSTRSSTTQPTQQLETEDDFRKIALEVAAKAVKD